LISFFCGIRRRAYGCALIVMITAMTSCSYLEPSVNQDTARAELVRVLGIWNSGKYDYALELMQNRDDYELPRFFDLHYTGRYRLKSYNIESVREVSPGKFAFVTTTVVEPQYLMLGNRQTIQKTYYVYLVKAEKYRIQLKDWLVADETSEARINRMLKESKEQSKQE
jgi:hypothetical protein